MSLKRVKCPACGAGLTSPTGYEVGQSVECTKCESPFIVEDVQDCDDGNEKRSYKNSPMRYAVLGVLVAVMIGLGVMLILKKQADRETEESNAKLNASENEGEPKPTQPNNGFDANGGIQPHVPPKLNGGPGVGGFPKGGAAPRPIPGAPPPPQLPKKEPGPGDLPPPKNATVPGEPMPPPKGGGTIGGLNIPGGAPLADSPEGKQLLATLRAKLIGSWEGTAPDGAVHKLTYEAGGKFTLDAGGKSTNGMWNAEGIVGGKVLKITRGTATFKVVFEGDDLLHDTETPGVAVVLKKK